MNVTLKLTMDGLIEALRWKALERQPGRSDRKPSSIPAAPNSDLKATETNHGK